MQLIILGLLLFALHIPPPLFIAELPVKIQLITVGLLETLHIPAPMLLAELPVKIQLITVGLLLFELHIPPPSLAELPVKIQLITVGLLESLYIPLPFQPLPEVMVKPSRVAVASRLVPSG